MSEYGAHLVYIYEATDSYIPGFVASRERVLDDVIKQQLRDLKNENYEKMKQGYQITIDYDANSAN